MRAGGRGGGEGGYVAGKVIVHQAWGEGGVGSLHGREGSVGACACACR